MTRLRARWLLVLTVLVLAPQPADAGVRLTVVDCSTNQPLAGALLTADTGERVQTDRAGTAVIFPQPPNREHEVMISGAGYQPKRQRFFISATQVAPARECLTRVASGTPPADPSAPAVPTPSPGGTLAPGTSAADKAQQAAERAKGLVQDAGQPPVVTPGSEDQTGQAIQRLGSLLRDQPAPPPPPVTPPAAPASVCGPDLTRNVLAVLLAMRDEFLKADEAKQESACNALVSPRHGEYAWDIIDLFEGPGEFPSSANPQGVASFAGAMTGGACCVPSYPCGPTIELFGTCHNMQVVNYVMWGMTRSLCSKFTGINLQQSIVHTARNRNSPNKAEQDVMTDVGQAYGEELSKAPSFKDLERSMLSGDVARLRDRTLTDPTRYPGLKALLANAEATSTRDYKQCATTCRLPLGGVATKLDFRWFGLKWPGGEAEVRRPGRSRQDFEDAERKAREAARK